VRGARRVSRAIRARAIAPLATTSRRAAVLLPLFLFLLLFPRAARADGSFDGKWREGALREDYTVPQWTPSSCGPTPVSAQTGGGDVVSIHQEGDELAIAGGGRVYRTNQCYDLFPTLARETHSRDPSGRSWRTRCSTPPSDPRRATMNTLVIASSDSHIDIIETGRYEIVIQDARCIADVRRSRTFDLVAPDQPAPAPAASSAPAPAVTAAPPVPPPAPAHASCDSPGPPARLEVRPSQKLLRTGESFVFHPVVLDANGCATGTATTWTLAPGGGTTLLVDPSGRVSAPMDAAEGSAQVVVSAAGRSAKVTVDVTSPGHYDDLLARSGLNSQGENESASVAELATGSLGAGDARAEDTAKGRRLLFIAIVGGLALALGAAAVVFARRQKRAAALEVRAEEAYEERVRLADQERSAKRSAHEAAVRAHQESLTRAKEAARAAAQREAESRAFSPPSPQRMVCPTCRREYPMTSTYCPQDATKLVPFQGSEAGGGAALGSICPACKRGFATGTRVCPQDGEELVPYAMHAAVAGPGAATPSAPPRGKICPTCGGRFDGNATFCGKDGTALVLIN
jgi:hypothetical protein